MKGEVDVLSALKHPNIVEFIGIKNLDNKIYIIMEYMNHGNLLSYIREEETLPSEDKLLDMTKQIVDGMTFLEEKGVIHR